MPVCLMPAAATAIIQGKIEKALADKNASIAGIDISKFALIAAAKRSKNIRLAVASVFALPTADFSCDAVLNVCLLYTSRCV